MASDPTRGLVRPGDPAYRRCLSLKVGYATYDEALLVAERMMADGRVDPGCHITPYACSFCDEWHVWNKQNVATRRGKQRRRFSD